MGVKEDIKKLPWMAQIGLFVGIAIAIIIISKYLFINKIQMRIDAAKAELSNLQMEIQKGRESKARTEQFQQEIKRIETQLEFLKKILPEKEEISDLYSKIQEQGTRFGLQISNFQPRGSSEKEFYSEYPIDLDINGEYHSLAKFFEEIGHLQRIVNISSFTAKAASFKNKPEYTLTAKLQASTYTYKEEKIK